MLFQKNQQDYGVAYQTPPNPSRKRLMLIISVVLMLLVVGIIVAALSSGSKSSGSSEIVSSFLGGDAYIDRPANFVSNAARGKKAMFTSPEGTKPQESIQVMVYQTITETSSLSDIQSSITSNSSGPIEGQTSRKLSREEQEDGKGEQLIFATAQPGQTEGTTTDDFYYFYSDRVWLVSITHGNNTALQKSLERIMNSFKAGNL